MYIFYKDFGYEHDPSEKSGKYRYSDLQKAGSGSVQIPGSATVPWIAVDLAYITADKVTVKTLNKSKL